MTSQKSNQVAIGALMLLIMSAVAQADADSHNMDSDAVGGEARIMHLAGDHDMSFGGGITMIAQDMKGNSAAPDASGITYSVDIAFEGDFGDKGTALIYLNTAQGTSVDPQAGAGGVNADDETGIGATGYSNTRIAEAWYKIPLGQRVVMTVGKIDPRGIYDGNEVANDQTSQFLGDVFVNNAAIEFPGFSGGISVGVDVYENVSLNVGAFEATDDFAGNQNLRFSIAELGLATELMGQPTNVRLATWQRSDNDNKGIAVSADHAINDVLTAFVRYGTQEDTQNFDSALSLGGQWAINNDMLGFAYSQAAGTGTGPDPLGTDAESQLEIYYSYAIADHIHITADLQKISNPGFDASLDDITVMGLRIQTDL
jgi:carbohydrate-selective porin OprB